MLFESTPNNAATAEIAVDDLARAVRTEAAGLEPQFVRLTEALGVVLELARTSAAVGAEVAKDVGARLRVLQEAGLVTMVDAAHRSLRAQVEHSEQRLHSLNDSLTNLLHLRDLGNRMLSLAGHLCVTRLGFSIETAKLSNGQAAAFRDFVGELAKLEKVFAGVGRRLGETAISARDAQAKAAEAIENGLDECRILISQCETRSRSAASTVESLLGSIGTLTSEIVAGATAVRAEAAEIVYFLQIGDMVRQKLEHVATALERSIPQKALANVLRVQIAQLQQVQTETADAKKKLGAAFQGLGKATSDLIAPVLRIGGDANRRDHGSFNALLADSGELQALGQSAAHLGEESARVTTAAATVAQQIVAQLTDVEETNSTMHIMALNAIINTSRIGAGAAALGALSVQVHEIARDSSTILKQIRPLCDRLRGNPTQAEAPATIGTAREAIGFGTSLAELDSLRTTVRASAERVSGLGNRQATAIDAAAVQTRFFDELNRRLGAVILTLQQRLTLALPASDVNGPALGASEYTMESERQVHQSVLAGDQDAAASPVAKSTGDGLGDNVELF